MKVTWALKDWSEFSDEDKKGLAKHLKDLGKEKAKEYIVYLSHHCKAPKGKLLDFINS